LVLLRRIRFGRIQRGGVRDVPAVGILAIERQIMQLSGSGVDYVDRFVATYADLEL
jgi:hypothetical protein